MGTEQSTTLAEMQKAVEIALEKGVSPIPDYLPQFAGVIAYHVSDVLGSAGDLARASAAARAVEGVVDTTMANQKSQDVDCKKGCYYCCQTYQLTATAPEYFLAFKRLRELAPEMQEKVEAQIRSSKSLTREGVWEEKQACPLLVDTLCSVHTLRPVSCRSFTSVDLETCMKAFRREQAMTDSIPTPWPHAAAGMTAKAGLRAGLLNAGYPHEAYEAVGALQILLDQDDAEQAWLGGEDVFAGVLTDAGDAEFDALVENARKIATSAS